MTSSMRQQAGQAVDSLGGALDLSVVLVKYVWEEYLELVGNQYS